MLYCDVPGKDQMVSGYIVTFPVEIKFVRLFCNVRGIDQML